MELTIVVPTYNEQDTIGNLVEEINSAVGGGLAYEIVIVDDSTDDTPQLLHEMSERYKHFNYIHRENERGLGSAVVEGFRHAKGKYIIVMDADLQHPPSLIPLILERLHQVDVVIPSRFIQGGSDGGLNSRRKAISWVARTIGRWSIGRLRNISDCTSGYFGIHRSVVEDVKLAPIGWKILMEVLVKGKHQTVHEIPYSFVSRNIGQSKMSLREQWNYLIHVGYLIRSNPDDQRFYYFCFIGLLGVVVNLIALIIMFDVFGIEGIAASVGASAVAMIHNYVLNDRITWRENKVPGFLRRVLQIMQFLGISGLGILITALIVRSFLVLGWNIYFGQIAGIAIATFWSFSANNRWTWSKGNSAEVVCAKLTVTQECSREIS